MSVLTTEAIVALAALVDDIDFDGAEICHVEMGELADGSMRPFALVTTIEAVGLEQVYRVCGPAATGAPVWASKASTVEVRVADRWRIIPFADQPDEPASAPGLLERVGAYLPGPA